MTRPLLSLLAAALLLCCSPVIPDGTLFACTTSADCPTDGGYACQPRTGCDASPCGVCLTPDGGNLDGG